MLIGFIGPFIIMVIIWIINKQKYSYPYYPFADFISLAYEGHTLGLFITLASIINLASFWILLQINREYIARGVIIATFIIGAIILLLKFAII